MRNFRSDDRGQLILIACVAIVLAIVLISVYELSTMGTGENSINRENKDSYYYYKSIRDRYSKVYNESYMNMSNSVNITLFEKELKEFALLHGYSVDFIRNDTQATIVFIDKDIRIEEVLK